MLFRYRIWALLAPFHLVILISCAKDDYSAPAIAQSRTDTFDLPADGSQTQPGRQLKEAARTTTEAQGPFRILSDTQNITGWNNTSLYGTLLPADHIHAILTQASAELQSLGDEQTPVWQFNYTDWAFYLYVQPNTTVSYNLVRGIVKRFLILLPTPVTQALEGARAGAILDGSNKVIGDVGFIPLTTNTTVGPAEDPDASLVPVPTTLPDPAKGQSFTFYGVNGTAPIDPGSINPSSLLDFINTTALAPSPKMMKRDISDAIERQGWPLYLTRTLTYLSINNMILTVAYQALSRGDLVGGTILAAGLLGAAVTTWIMRTEFEKFAKDGIWNLRRDSRFPSEEIREYHAGDFMLRGIFRAHDQWLYFQDDLAWVDLVLAFFAGLLDHIRGVPFDTPVSPFRAKMYVEVPDPRAPGGKRVVEAGSVLFNVGLVPRVRYRDEI